MTPDLPLNTRSQRERILGMLQIAGEQGVSNFDLNGVCFRYGSRIWELRKEGWDIVTIKRGRHGAYKFVLKGRKTEQRSLGL